MLQLRPGVLRAAHKDGLCVPCQEREEVEGGEEEVVVEDPNWVLAPDGNNHRTFFVVGVEEWEGGDCPPH